MNENTELEDIKKRLTITDVLDVVNEQKAVFQQYNKMIRAAFLVGFTFGGVVAGIVTSMILVSGK